jgi:hypothetical protein
MSNIQGLPVKDLKPGSLRIVFEDGTCLDFVEDEIRKQGYQFLDDPSNVSDSVRKAVEFQRCSVCPERHHQGYCHALLPTLSSLERIDKYPSFAPVTALYRDKFSAMVTIRETTLQVALQFISVLSLIDFCELGREYRDLFVMINPIMDPRDVAARIYLNLFWQMRGDEKKVAEKMERFTREMEVTILCQIERLRLVCKSDAFINAFVMTHVLTSILKGSPETSLDKCIQEHLGKQI